MLKIGGRSLEAPGAPEELAAEVASLSGALLLVHGGGREVTDWCARLAIESRFVEGLRVTDDATLDVAAAVLAGLANKRLVAGLRNAGVDAVGLSAADGVADVVPHPDAARLGRVGAVKRIDPTLIKALIEQGRTPVLASIGAMAGRLVNLNADDLAAAVAGSLGARMLVLLSDAPGVRIGSRVVPELAPAEIEAALRLPDVRDGMVVKLKAGREAIARGVPRVRIASWEGPGTLRALLESPGIGTTLLAETRGNDE